MVQQVINVGLAPDDGLGDPARVAFQKSNANFTELYTHVNDVLSNPHNVTASQTGAYTSGEVDTLFTNHLGAPDPHPVYALATDLDNYLLLDASNDPLTGTLDVELIRPSLDNTFDYGEPARRIRRAFFGANVTGGTVRANFTGLHIYTGVTDIFVGEDNIFDGYYVQKALPPNSLVTNNSLDFSNLYQGDSVEPYIYTNFNTGDGSVVSFSGSNVGTLVGSIIQGDYTGALGNGGGGIYINSRAVGSGVVLQGDAPTASFHYRGSPAIGHMSNPILSLGFGGDAVTTIKPVSSLGATLHGVIDLGEVTNRWKDCYLSGGIFVGGSLAHEGALAGFYGTTPLAQPVALTAANATAIDLVWSANEQVVVNNIRTRLNELETRLQSLGLIQ